MIPIHISRRMTQLKYPITIVTVSAAVFVVYVFIVGVFTLLKIPPNPCEMTYMFENPKYIPVPVYKGSSKYKLYAYGEGRYAKSLFQGRFHGIPVLFIPGNAGCFKQVRSLASVAYRMHEDLHKPHHFNYFTVDFNEEFSGLYGGVLYTQSEYVVAALEAIQKLYSEPKKVILIGHSMGGLVARSVFVHPEFQYNSVDLILTLSTPHNTAPLQFDWSIHSFYSDWWTYVESNPRIYKDKLFISIGSGIRDTMIQPYQTTIHEIEENTINVLTTCIPDVHVSPDHLQMVWCRQLIKKINHALFDMIDKNTLKLTEDISIMRDIARVSFLGVQPTLLGTGKKRETENVVDVKDMLFQAAVTSREGWKKFVIPAKDGFLTAIIVQNPPPDRWLYYCVGDDCKDVSGEAILFPDNFAVYTSLRKGGRYEVFINGAHGRERKSSRSMITSQHHPGGTQELTSYETDSIKISDRAEQVLSLPGISSTDFWVVSKVTVKQTSCSLLKSTQRLPIGRMKYEREDTFYKGTADGVEIMVELLTVDPSKTSLSSPQIQLILDPACSYTVSMETEGFRTAANLIRYHYQFIGGLLLFTLLGLCANLVGGSRTSILHSLTQDLGSMFTFLFIVVVKFVLWILPALHGLFGIDWMTVEGEILLTVLLMVHTSVYTVYNLGAFFSSLLFKLVTLVRLDDCRPVFFCWKVQTVLITLGLLTSGSWVSLLNLLFFVFFVVSRRNVHPELHAFLLLLLYGIGLQLPVILSWLKNLTLRHYWLEGDAASRVTMAISLLSCYVATTLCNGSTATTRSISPQNISKVVLGLNLLRFLTVTLVLTRVYLVLPFLFAALLLLTGFFTLAPSKSKVS